MYAYGLVLWALCTGRLPLHERTREEFVRAAAEGTDLHPRTDCITAAPLRELMQRCWDQKADARPSAEQVVDLLQEMRSRHSLEYQWNMPAAHWGSLSRSPSMSPSMQRVYQGELHVRGGVAKAVLRVQG